jgi:hypothetical protein
MWSGSCINKVLFVWLFLGLPLDTAHAKILIKSAYENDEQIPFTNRRENSPPECLVRIAKAGNSYFCSNHQTRLRSMKEWAGL